MKIIQVDNNVTRNLKGEFEKNDWDVMILHYLGLDHIGHVYGPNSKLIPKKLAEMDAVVQNLYENTQKWKEKSAIFVTGDHGMKDTGGHGGSSFPETNVPLIVLKKTCSGGFIQQVDVAPSLSVLLGVDIPSGTVGHIITGFLEMLPIDFQNYLLLYNALVLNCDEYQEVLNEAKQFHYNFLKNGKIDDGLKAKSLYENYLVKNSEVLIKTSTQQDMNLIVLCLIVIIFCLLKIISFDNKDVTDLMLLLLLLCFSALYFTASIALLIVLIIKITIRTIRKINKLPTCTFNTILAVTTIIQLFALTSSSFIENEEYMWYFFLSTFLICATFSNTKSLLSFCKFVLAATLFRFLRSLDSNAYNWLLSLSSSDWFVKSENSSHVQPFFIFSLILVLLCCVLYTKSAVVTLLNVFTLINIYIFKCFYVNNVFLGRLIWAIIALNAVLNFCNRESFINSWLLVTSLLLREYNVILLPACIFLSKLICKTQENVFAKALLHFWLGNAFYFCQGHINSLASVNVSVGYIGLQDYVPAIVFSQVLCHTYALPVLTHLLLLKNCQNNEDCWFVLIVARLLFLIVVNVVTVIQRSHLFIWSVFSPKLLIESSHAAVLLLQLIIWFITIKLFKKYTPFFIFLQKKVIQKLIFWFIWRWSTWLQHLLHQIETNPGLRFVLHNSKIV